MNETEHDGSCRHMTSQSAKDFLATLWLELQDWSAVAFNSAGRFFTALFNVLMLTVTAIITLLAVMVLVVRDKITTYPVEDSTFSLISIKSLLKRTRASVSH